MKKLTFLLCLALFVVSCEKSGKNEPTNSDGVSDRGTTISCTPNVMELELTGGEFMVTIKATSEWSATANKSWVSVSPSSSQGDAFVTINVAKGSADSALVLFSNGTGTATLKIGRGVKFNSTPTNPPVGPTVTSGAFSISQGRKVRFAPGNLQFNAAQGTHQCADGTTQKGTWRFAEHQWDYVGDASNGNVYHNGTKCNNANISETYDGWIDLFGWGTSGWNSGANAYLPWSTSTSYSDYYPGGNANNNLTGAYANADWGVYNQIGSDASGTWRTLTTEEWLYICNTRPNASNLKGQATVNGVNGFVLLPDDFGSNSGTIVFTSGTHLGWNVNRFSVSQWEQMEQRGAVFLPSGGYRDGTNVYDVGSDGYFWSDSQYSTYFAYYFYFDSSFLYPQNYSSRYYGFSLRLVSVL